MYESKVFFACIRYRHEKTNGKFIIRTVNALFIGENVILESMEVLRISDVPDMKIVDVFSEEPGWAPLWMIAMYRRQLCLQAC